MIQQVDGNFDVTAVLDSQILPTEEELYNLYKIFDCSPSVSPRLQVLHRQLSQDKTGEIISRLKQ